MEPPPYTVTTKRCLGCEALAAERKAVGDNGGSDRNYIYGFAVKRDEGAHDEQSS